MFGMHVVMSITFLLRHRSSYLLNQRLSGALLLRTIRHRPLTLIHAQDQHLKRYPLALHAHLRHLQHKRFLYPTLGRAQ